MKFTDSFSAEAVFYHNRQQQNDSIPEGHVSFELALRQKLISERDRTGVDFKKIWSELPDGLKEKYTNPAFMTKTVCNDISKSVPQDLLMAYLSAYETKPNAPKESALTLKERQEFEELRERTQIRLMDIKLPEEAKTTIGGMRSAYEKIHDTRTRAPVSVQTAFLLAVKAAYEDYQKPYFTPLTDEIVENLNLKVRKAGIARMALHSMLPENIQAELPKTTLVKWFEGRIKNAREDHLAAVENVCAQHLQETEPT